MIPFQRGDVLIYSARVPSEYFAQNIKLAVLQDHDRHFYNNLRAKIIAAVALGKTKFTIHTDEPIAQDILRVLTARAIHNTGG